ncbi:uncharacterized protein METZ01_LOCUS323497, partial [marine metagenome]
GSTFILSRLGYSMSLLIQKLVLDRGFYNPRYSIPLVMKVGKWCRPESAATFSNVGV